VSVVVPAHNAERYIGSCLASVLVQTYKDFEIIVVDDGSTDGTRAVVLSMGGAVRYIHQTNAGPSAARNAGLAAARGEFICFLDADDLWLRGKLSAQVAFMDAHPDVHLIFADSEEFEDNGIQCHSLVPSAIISAGANSPIPGAYQKLLVENFIPTSTVMARRACFTEIGCFDATLRASEDRDLWSRIAARFAIACQPQVLGRKRVVPSSVSRDVETTLRSRIRLWTKARRLFPEMTPEDTVNALLVSTYLQLGFVLLRKGQTREARALARKSLPIARRPHAWCLATALIILSFLGTSCTEFAFAAKRWLVSARLRVGASSHT